MNFEARFPSRCGVCDGHIRVGDRCTYVEDSVAHDNCNERADPDSPRRTERKCPDCYTIHAGECL